MSRRGLSPSRVADFLQVMCFWFSLIIHLVKPIREETKQDFNHAACCSVGVSWTKLSTKLSTAND